MARHIRISLRAARVNAQMTQAQAAHALGISTGTLIKWEQHPSKISPENYNLISSVYGIPLSSISFAE